MTLVGFDTALDARLLVVTDEFLGRRDDFLADQATEDLGNHSMLRGFVSRFKFALVLAFQQLPVLSSALVLQRTQIGGDEQRTQSC